MLQEKERKHFRQSLRLQEGAQLTQGFSGALWGPRVWPATTVHPSSVGWRLDKSSRCLAGPCYGARAVLTPPQGQEGAEQGQGVRQRLGAEVCPLSVFQTARLRRSRCTSCAHVGVQRFRAQAAGISQARMCVWCQAQFPTSLPLPPLTQFCILSATLAGRQGGVEISFYRSRNRLCSVSSHQRDEAWRWPHQIQPPARSQRCMKSGADGTGSKIRRRKKYSITQQREES